MLKGQIVSYAEQVGQQIKSKLLEQENKKFAISPHGVSKYSLDRPNELDILNLLTDEIHQTKKKLF